MERTGSGIGSLHFAIASHRGVNVDVLVALFGLARLVVAKDKRIRYAHNSWIDPSPALPCMGEQGLLFTTCNSPCQT